LDNFSNWRKDLKKSNTTHLDQDWRKGWHWVWLLMSMLAGKC